MLSQGKLIAEGDVNELRHRLSAGRWVEVEVDSPDRAIAVANGIGLATSKEAAGRIRVQLDAQVKPHELNRALVTAGVEVSALAEVRESLETTFLGLISEPTRGEPAAPATQATPAMPDATTPPQSGDERDLS